MAWRVAASLLALRDQVNAAWPSRSRRSDGTIGDASHRNRNSDHNPWVEDGRIGVVTALDITHDIENGCDAGRIARAIRDSKDKRVKYIIWNRKICSSTTVGGTPEWTWRNYTGANPHDKHVHISVKSSKNFYDLTSKWNIDANSVISDPLHPEVTDHPLLKRGSRAGAVRELQTLLNRHGSRLEVDGRFGEDTEGAVKAFQRAKGLFDDGIVGAKTWAALLV